MTKDAADVIGATLVVDGGRLLVGGETTDLLGKCDSTELAAHFDTLKAAADAS